MTKCFAKLAGFLALVLTLLTGQSVLAQNGAAAENQYQETYEDDYGDTYYYEEELEDIEYEPGEGLHEEEWYDPSDWFDFDEGVEYETDDYYDEYYYEDDYGYYDDGYYNDDWFYDYYDTDVY